MTVNDPGYKEEDSSRMTPPPPLACEVENCGYSTEEGIPSHELRIERLKLHHQQRHNQQINPKVNLPKPAQLPRPELPEEASEQEWLQWKSKWERYKRSCLQGVESKMVVDQLMACCSKDLEDTIWKQVGGNLDTEKELLDVMKKLGVKRRNVLLNKVSFFDMSQNQDEKVKHYVARLRGQAATCNFSVTEGTKDYSEQMIQHQLIRGLSDQDIQEHVLAHAATDEGAKMDLDTTVRLIEAKELGKADSEVLHKSSHANKMSEYQKVKNQPKDQGGSDQPCSFCKKKGHGSRAPIKIRKSSCPAWDKECGNCGKLGHFKEVCRSKRKNEAGALKAVEGNEVDASRDTEGGVLGSISNSVNFCKLEVREDRKGRVQVVDHYEYVKSSKQFIRRRPEKHPSVIVEAEVCMTAYDQLGLKRPNLSMKVSSYTQEGSRQMGKKLNTGQVRRKAASLPDTGAQMCVTGLNVVYGLGLRKSDLFKVKTGVSAANNGKLTVLGGVFLTFTIQGETTSQLVYVTEEATCVFLSKAACRDLAIIHPDFPEIGGHITPTVSGCTATENEDDDGAPCTCPKRTRAPAPPTIPFRVEDTEECRVKLEEFILDYYKASAFNQCERQPLPLMDGHPPLELHVEEGAKPYSVHKARPVPLHWHKGVKEGLDRDCSLGVLEQVPMGDPEEWCAAMHIAAKKNGDPRRTIDFQRLNKACKRQTHAVEAPFHQASAVPANTKRTVLDAWNGYHSVPLKEEDRSKTTFITPWGRYRYKTAPQGFLAAGDAYTARYDRIIADFQDVKKCVDDSILWANTLEEIFNHTCKYISHCAEAGISFNPTKFRFGADEVEFLGFQLTKDGVQPTEKYIDSIRDFPEPKDITGARSWFGLINQVNYAYSESDLMEPFRPLLKPGTKFVWTEELAQAFKSSKAKIIEAVKRGVKNFKMGRPTCLATDWSKVGLGFALLQKTCGCSDVVPTCCKGGWELTYAGSRFTTSAESRYHPVEGEALSSAWALHKTRHFTLGCKALVLAVDHKPLLKILGDRELGEIDNPRILNFKEKTLRWNFKVVHVPGVLHKIADATSRSPVGNTDRSKACNTLMISTEDLDESIREGTNAGLCSIGGRSIEALSWDTLNRESGCDGTISDLRMLIMEGLPEVKEEWPKHLQDFYARREELTCVDNVVMLGSRAVIPRALRKIATEILHSGHCGVAGMSERAREVMFWPRMTEDIEAARAECRTCIRIAPSQPSAPPTELPTPEYPFQQVSTDYFEVSGKHYMVFVCRYSNWLSVYHSKSGKTTELLTVLRRYMGTFGVMEELATDGDTVYTSKEAQEFFKRFNIKHRVSSSYFPHSNQRAETAVKAAKRMIQENTGPNGSLDTDAFLSALLMHRNTPSAALKMSPSEVVFGRKIRDLLPVKEGQLKMNPEWHSQLQMRDAAMARRHAKRGQDLEEHTRKLRRLKVGEVVSIQDQKGNNSKRWNCTGTIVEVKEFDQYVIQVDGSGRLTIRNRKFLRPLITFKDDLKEQNNQEAVKETQPRRSVRLTEKNGRAMMITCREVKDEFASAPVFFRPWEQLSSEQARPRTTPYPAPAPK